MKWPCVLTSLALTASVCVVAPTSSANAIGHHCVLGPGANLVGCNLSDKNIGGDLVGANFTDANLGGSNLSGNFTRANFTGADFVGQLKQGNLTGNFTDANFTRANVASEILSSGGGLNGEDGPLLGNHFAGANFTEARMDGTDLGNLPYRADFDGATFADAQLSGGLDGGSFVGTNFVGANLSDTWIQGHLTNTNFTRANLTEDSFYGATLVNTTFLDANLNGVSFLGSTYDHVVCPDGILEGLPRANCTNEKTTTTTPTPATTNPGPSMSVLASKALTYWNSSEESKGETSTCLPDTPRNWVPGYKVNCFIHPVGGGIMGEVVVTATKSPSPSQYTFTESIVNL